VYTLAPAQFSLALPGLLLTECAGVPDSASGEAIGDPLLMVVVSARARGNQKLGMTAYNNRIKAWRGFDDDNTLQGW
jgi:hypothetical protein